MLEAVTIGHDGAIGAGSHPKPAKVILSLSKETFTAQGLENSLETTLRRAQGDFTLDTVGKLFFYSF